MLAGARVVVIVPCFDEEDRVGRVVETMPGFVDRIFVVDDGSRDSTAARAQIDPRVRLLRHAKRSGVGAALVTGYRAAIAESGENDHDAFCVMAGDGQMAPGDLEHVALPIVRGEADYVKGERFTTPGVRQSMGLPRFIGGRVFSRLTSLAIGQPITDSQCGFTALSRRAAVVLDLDGLFPGFGYPNDLLGQLAVFGMRIAEVPVRPIYAGEKSKLRLRHLPRIFYLILRAAMRRRSSNVIRMGDKKQDGLRGSSAVSSS
jgi:glycosyltransferase involved in cell wall biosynthesis